MNPDELLQQIKDLLQQYLALGPNTPVAAEAQSLSDAIDTSAGGAGDTGGLPPEGDLGGAPPTDVGGDMGTDPMMPQPGEPPANPTARTFGDANTSALDRLKKRNQKSKAY